MLKINNLTFHLFFLIEFNINKLNIYNEIKIDNTKINKYQNNNYFKLNKNN